MPPVSSAAQKSIKRLPNCTLDAWVYDYDDEDDDDEEIGADDTSVPIAKPPLKREAFSTPAEDEGEHYESIQPIYTGPNKGTMDLNTLGRSESENAGQKERGTYRGGKFNRPPREPRPPRQEADPQSNYILYYEKDPNFYLTILKEEEPGEAGHEFKLQLLKDRDPPR